jgi:long-chain acyl-CoA synthetase
MERVVVEAVGADGHPVPRGEEGRVRVTSPAVALASVGGDQSDSGISGRTFLTGDLGRLDAQDRLTLTGRVGDLINVAGKKVHPEEVRRVLEEVPGVVAAAVVGLADRHRGQVVAAVLAVVSGSGVTVPRVLAHCRARLAPHKIPRRIALAGELPSNDRGKLPREAVQALLARTPDQA